MALPVSKARGGYHRTWDDGKTPLLVGPFIRDQLSMGDMVAHDIYIAYKNAVKEMRDPVAMEGLTRRRRKEVVKEWKARGIKVTKLSDSEKEILKDEVKSRVAHWLTEHPGTGYARKKCMNYNSFQHYIYILRQLGLIENTGEEFIADGKSGSESMEWHEGHPSKLLRATDLGSPAWENPWEAYQANKEVL